MCMFLLICKKKVDLKVYFCVFDCERQPYIIFESHDSWVMTDETLFLFSLVQYAKNYSSYLHQTTLLAKNFFSGDLTVDPKYFDYKLLATLDERGHCIPNDGDKRGGRKGYQYDQNYNRWFHGALKDTLSQK